VTEYVPEDLSRYAKALRVQNPCPYRQLIGLAASVCDAVQKMYSTKERKTYIFHGDIKASNVLIRQTPQGPMVSLCDFGASRHIPRRGHSGGDLCFCTTATFSSPEAFGASEEEPVEFSHEMDLWSLGMTVLEVVYGGDFAYDLNEWVTKDWLKKRAWCSGWKWEWDREALNKELFCKVPKRIIGVEIAAFQLMSCQPQGRIAPWMASRMLRRIERAYERDDAALKIATSNDLDGNGVV
jgi:serine/threonine protein kinase